MGFAPDQLRDKALIALEEVVQECRYRRPRRTFALRFALAYLWASGGAQRAPFEQFWRVLGDQKSPWSFSAANGALLAIYRALDLERDEEVAMALWKRCKTEEETSSQC
ncbi:MAG: hypothetical protein ACXWUP_12460 [Allosphingosinicella sp.]